jgi:hypothetical protein
MSTITPLATAAPLAARLACSAHVVTVASAAEPHAGGVAFVVVLAVILFLVALTRAVLRVAALIGNFLQLAAAMTSAILTMLIAAAVAVVLLVH